MFLEPSCIGAKRQVNRRDKHLLKSKVRRQLSRGEAVRRAPCDLTESGALRFVHGYVFPREYVEKAKIGVCGGEALEGVGSA